MIDYRLLTISATIKYPESNENLNIDCCLPACRRQVDILSLSEVGKKDSIYQHSINKTQMFRVTKPENSCPTESY